MQQMPEPQRHKARLQDDLYALPYHWFVAPPSPSTSLGDQLHYMGAIDSALNWLMPLTGKSVLDAGCGEGRVSFELIRRGARVWGVDVSERAIVMARVLVPQAQFAASSLLDLRDLRDGFFDCVVLLEVIEHLPESERGSALRELHRVLAPHGTLVISVPSDIVPLDEKHYLHFSPQVLADTVDGLFRIDRIMGCHRKTPWYSVLARCIDNRFLILPALLKAVYGRFIKVCPPSRGVQLLALCTKEGSRES
jgi:2-polyprenyl-3-methyl-5-hydroxy-6-metoxy-1,4-benzoquinol methylase